MEYNIKFEGTLKVAENSAKPEVSGLSVKPFNVKMNDNTSPSELISELMKGKEIPEDVKNIGLKTITDLLSNILNKKEDKK